ncbi:helix-turn-helix transcriptional regulator [Aquihabitans daechungensis]|uniref:helix-turn-helix transcriptional regulator n=1 Tax=Aquihabitans daechungensis TaxID=1052257 RepID=UPI003BA3D224
MRAPRLTAAGRLQRLLAILQWAAQHPEGALVSDLCDRFQLDQEDLVKELDLANMINADSPFYDEMPFEVFLEEDRVFVRLFSFRRPMRLTPAEGLALVAAADSLIEDPPTGAGDGHDPGPLARALTKLADLLGIEPGQAVDVEVDPDGGEQGRRLRQAMEADRQVSFVYWTYGRDAVARRVVDPWEVFTEHSAWYLAGWAHDPGAARNFRLDRMGDLTIEDEPRSHPAPKALDRSARTVDEAPQVVLDLAPWAWWVAEAHPVISAEAVDDQRLRVTLAVAGASWLERLLLRLGSGATVVQIDEELGGPDLAARAASRVLARYQPADGAQEPAR